MDVDIRIECDSVWGWQQQQDPGEEEEGHMGGVLPGHRHRHKPSTSVMSALGQCDGHLGE